MYYLIIVSPVRSTYGGYYGLVVVTPPPRPQTLHRSHDNLKNPYRIASIFYMYIDIGERIAGKQDGPGLIIYGPPRAPRIAQNANFFHIGGPYMKNWWLFLPLLWICLLCDEVLLAWNFRSPGFDVRAPQHPPNMIFFYFFSYFGFKLKNFLSDCFLIWHVHKYGCEDSWKAR